MGLTVKPTRKETGAVTRYPVTLRALSAEDGGGFLAEAPDLPGCMSDGESPEEALANVGDAIATWLAAAKELGHAIPKPGAVDDFSGRWVQRVPRSLHMRLSERARREGVSLNTLVTSLIAEGLGTAATVPARKEARRRPARERNPS